jgi:hypothetical protein
VYDHFCSWWNWKPAAGFRFSWTDGLAVALCAFVTWGTWPFLGTIAVLFPVVLGHFFLFCNVFRIARELELLWSAIFMTDVGMWVGLESFTWSRVLLTQTPVTILLIALTVFRTDYHGVGYLLVPWGRRRGIANDVGPDQVSFGKG